MKLRETISWLMGTLQQSLFPYFEDCSQAPLTEKQKHLIQILEIVQVEKFVPRSSSHQWMGRRIREREAIARSFVAKAIYQFLTTRLLIAALKETPQLRRICGFENKSDIPSESTFSRAFKEFSQTELGDQVHKTLVEDTLKAELVGHISRDATAIEGREKPARKPPKEKAASLKRGRPAKGKVREIKPESRLSQQVTKDAQESLKEIPVVCDVGSKKNSQGYQETWRGYKLHADVNDCGLPVSLILTSASVHDSQVAIPLMKISSSRVDYLYDVMDAAYDAKEIYEVSRALGHVPLIDKNSRGRELIPMAPHEAARYNERTASERFNSRIKEEFGARNVMVRGSQKVKLHLMFGVIALFADQLIKLIN
jgi:IS5 family transposase